MDELAVPGDGDNGAGYALGRYLTGEEIVEPRQARLRKSDLVRPGLRQRPGMRQIAGEADHHGCGHHERLHVLLPGMRTSLRDFFSFRTSADRIVRSRAEQRQAGCGFRPRWENGMRADFETIHVISH